MSTILTNSERLRMRAQIASFRDKPALAPLSAAELLACDDLSLLSRGELERLVWIIRAELDLAEAKAVLARNTAEIKAERKARAKEPRR